MGSVAGSWEAQLHPQLTGTDIHPTPEWVMAQVLSVGVPCLA